MSVSNVAELLAAVDNSAIDKILVAAGTYNFVDSMCTHTLDFSYDYDMVGSDGDMVTDGAAICINRAVTIEAQVPGSVVLNAGGGGRRTLPREERFAGWHGATFIEAGLRVVFVDFGGAARLIGLNITGGYANVRSVALFEHTC